MEAVIGLFSFVGGLIGGGKAKKASRRAEAARLEAINKGIAESARQFDITQKNFASEQAFGEKGIAAYSDLVGFNGEDAQASAIGNLRNSPLYQSLFNNGRDAILANASATGGLRGGNIQDGLARFSADTLASVIENQLGRYGSAINVGSGADTTIGAFGEGAVNAQNNLRLGGAEARANGLLTRAGINAQNFQNFGSFLDNGISTALGGGGGFNIGKLLKGLF